MLALIGAAPAEAQRGGQAAAELAPTVGQGVEDCSASVDCESSGLGGAASGRLRRDRVWAVSVFHLLDNTTYMVYNNDNDIVVDDSNVCAGFVGSFTTDSSEDSALSGNAAGLFSTTSNLLDFVYVCREGIDDFGNIVDVPVLQGKMGSPRDIVGPGE